MRKRQSRIVVLCCYPSTPLQPACITTAARPCRRRRNRHCRQVAAAARRRRRTRHSRCRTRTRQRRRLSSACWLWPLLMAAGEPVCKSRRHGEGGGGSDLQSERGHPQPPHRKPPPPEPVGHQPVAAEPR